jgi:hypothetical protein
MSSHNQQLSYKFYQTLKGIRFKDGLRWKGGVEVTQGLLEACVHHPTLQALYRDWLRQGGPVYKSHQWEASMVISLHNRQNSSLVLE